MADRFFIAPYDKESGLQTNFKPWLIPDQAFALLNNAYVFRGRVRKRFGTRWFGNTQMSSRFAVVVGSTDGSGNATGFVPLTGGVPIITPAIGQMFAIGNDTYTVYTLGTPANLLNNVVPVGAATFDTTTGAFSFTGAAASQPIYYFPALPVMGLLSFENSNVNNAFVIGFDTQFAYTYSAGNWVRLSGETTPGAATWKGTDSDFFWGTTWTGSDPSAPIFFVTNFNQTSNVGSNETNYMRQFDGATWNNFRPLVSLQVSGTDTTRIWVDSARLIVVFKNRLVLLNTWEETTVNDVAAIPKNFVNRARYSVIGDPTAADSWRRDLSPDTNSIDAATTEAIVSAEFIKDRLIVFFEKSTWELAYTGNQVQPFTWQKINTELGAVSTFSIVPFDKIVLGIDQIGIHACSGANVDRIDYRIPQEVFEVNNNNNGDDRLYGIRDYYVEMVYWTYPNITATKFPNTILAYNYRTNTWSLNDDSLTAFGYYQPVLGITWDSFEVSWDSDTSWDGGNTQAGFRQVIAGNQEGFTFICDADCPTNALSLQITFLSVVSDTSGSTITVTVINHNLAPNSYIYINGIQGTGNLALLNDKIFQVIDSQTNPITQDTFAFIYQDNASTIIAGDYEGGGLISRVSNIQIKTKEYNFYADKGRNVYISKVDFMVDATAAGQIQVDYYVSTSAVPLLELSLASKTLIGTGTLDTFPYTLANATKGVMTPIQFEEDATRLWHPVYLQGDGEIVQFYLNMNDAQMRNTEIRQCGFQLHALVIHAQPTSYRLQ